jgi:spore coat protein U-like protein
MALGATFEPTALMPGGVVSAVITGTCKNLSGASPGTVTLTFNAGTYYSSGFGYRGILCALCAGPSPYNTLYYQLFKTDGITPLSSGGTVVLTCSTGDCTSGGAGTYSYTFYGQLAQPVATTSLNDSQVGSYTDTAMTINVTGAGDTSPATVTVSMSGSAAQSCTIGTGSNIAFGAYNPVSLAGVTNATGSLVVTCTRSSSGVTLTLSGGNNGGNATAPSTRAMKGASFSNYISYDVFEDAGYATRFPTTAVAESIAGGITAPSSLSLFGQIPSLAQDVNVDAYSDLITATVNF